MVDIPEHLLVRSAEARAKALGISVEQALAEMKGESEPTVVAKEPEVKALDDFWHAKDSEDEEGRAVRRDTADQLLLDLEEEGLNPTEHIELPSPSYFPFVLASGLPFLGYAVIYKSIPLTLVGVVLLLIGGFGWGIEPLEEEVEIDE